MDSETTELLAFFAIDPALLSKEDLSLAVKKAYRKLVLKHHPDKNGDPKEFRKVQEKYEAFKKSVAKAKPKTEKVQRSAMGRCPEDLFKIFRNHLVRHHFINGYVQKKISRNDDESAWLDIFVKLCSGAEFIYTNRVDFLYGHYDYWYLNFLPPNITLQRLFRAFALNNIANEDPAFKAIEQMMLKELPWNFKLLRDMIFLQNPAPPKDLF